MAQLRQEKVVLALCVFAIGVGIFGISVGYSATKSAAEKAQQEAEEAHDIAISATIQRERICTETNQLACRALFNRLARNLTNEQRFRLACGVLMALDREAVREIKEASGCR